MCTPLRTATPKARYRAEKSIKPELLARLAAAVESFYGAEPQASPDFGRIVNDHHFQRLLALMGVACDPSQVRIVDLVKAIRAAGYTAGSATTRVHIKNMHCSSCVIRIELALQTTPGAIAARASAFTNAVDIEYLPERTGFAAIRAAVESIAIGWQSPRRRQGLQKEMRPIQRRRRGRRSTPC